MTGATLSPEFPGQGVYLPISISWGESTHSCNALVDSGAAGNFIDSNFALKLNVPLVPLEVPLSVSALMARLWVMAKSLKQPRLFVSSVKPIEKSYPCISFIHLSFQSF